MIVDPELPKLTLKQAIVLSVILGRNLTPAINILRDISERVGRPVQASEFKNPEFLESVQELYVDEFMYIIHQEKVSGLILPPGAAV